MILNQMSSWQAFIAITKKPKKGKFRKSKKKEHTCKVQCFGCNEFGHFNGDYPNKTNNKRKEISEAHKAEEMGEPKKKLKKHVKNIYY